MKYIERTLTSSLIDAARAFPAVVVTGARRAGKTTLLRHVFPDAQHHLLEDPDLVARFRADPRSVLGEIRPPAIIDEIQNAPEILNYLRTRIDANPQQCGQWLLTGSQEAPLMQGVTESMAGRAAVLRLLPMSLAETDRASILNGGFPEVLARPQARQLWFQSYIQTYLERDVRSVAGIRDLVTFRRFIALLASRHGQMLNRTDLAAPLGVAVNTINAWLNILEITSQIVRVPPFYENFGKRLVKSPKVYFIDSGLTCHLLGIETESALDRSPFLGPVFEGLVASEILKRQFHAGRSPGLYYFRDRQGLEVDFLIDLGDRRLALVEAKATRTPTPQSAEATARLNRAIDGYDVRRYVVHRAARDAPSTNALAPGVKALPVESIGRIWDPDGAL